MEKRVQLIYDTKSGVVLGTHTFVLEEGADAIDPRSGWQWLTDAGGPLEGMELALLDADEAAALPQRPLRVDVATGHVAVGWALRLSAPRTQLEGDGADTVELEIAALDENGDVDATFEDEVRVTTSRGRLSERGGLLRLAGGTGGVTLTSVAETVDRVVLTVTDPGGRATPASLELEFV